LKVLLRWGLQRGTGVLPKSTNAGRIQSNLEVVDWELSAADMGALSGLEFQVRKVSLCRQSWKQIAGVVVDQLHG
jgi:diketogulonate reductase-like aldo/keto reductase